MNYHKCNAFPERGLGVFKQYRHNDSVIEATEAWPKKFFVTINKVCELGSVDIVG